MPVVPAVLAALVVLSAAAPACAAAEEEGTPEAFTLRDARITESSGLAASTAHPGVYWTHNDSEDGPYVYAVDGDTGRTVATVTLQGIEPRDVEGISVGPDGDVYVGDIGDNFGGRWPEVWIYRFPEPERLRDTTVAPVRYTVRYADGPRDAESLMVHPETGRVYLASKNEDAQGGVYAGPEKLSASGVNTFRRIAGTEVWATDGAFSPDGTRLVLRGYFSAQMYRWTEQGRPEPLGRVGVPMQRQGESVTFAADGRTLLFGSEGEQSRVEPEALEGELLPETARREEAAEGADGAGGAAGEEDPAVGTDPEDDRTLVVGGLTFAAAFGLWLALRRLARRSSG
ncbi:hypothetical protein HOY81_20685 [Streptomyces sp. JJ36]|nr:hypothetical protein [Streptomyces sp. JJ36]